MNQDGEEERHQKPRRDKGTVLYSQRDEYCLGWMADQYAVRLDQVQKLLSRWPMGKLKDKERGLAATTVKDQINRWQRAGWIEYQRVLVNQPGWAWITRRGLQVIDWDSFYSARQPAFSRLSHIYAVNQVRLAMDLERDITWKSEREYREELGEARKGESTGPIPDAVISGEKVGRVAIEVELSPKKPADLERKLEELVSCSDNSNRYKFGRIWMYVPDEKGKQAVERARAQLIEADQKRVQVAVFQGLIA